MAGFPVYGVDLVLKITIMMMWIWVCSSDLRIVLQLLGILLRVIAATLADGWTMSAAAATIGQLLLTATTRTTCTSTTMAMSSRRTTTTFVRTAGLSVASKNNPVV